MKDSSKSSAALLPLLHPWKVFSHHLIPIILLLWYTQALREPQPPPSSKTPGAEKCSAKPSTDICCQAAFLPLLWEGQIHHSHTFLHPSQKSHWKAGPAEKAAPPGYYSKDAERYLSSGVTDRFSRSSSSAVKKKILSSHLINKASVTQHCFKSTSCVTTVSVSHIFIFTTPFLDVGNNLSPGYKTGIRNLISSADLASADDEYSLTAVHPHQSPCKSRRIRKERLSAC